MGIVPYKHGHKISVTELQHIGDIYIVVLKRTDDGSLGLSSQEAFKRLFDAIRDELTAFTAAINSCTWRRDLWSALSVNHHLPISFISLTFLILEFLVMILSYALAGTTRK